MKVCVFGAGAIGGYIGALLAHHGVEVTLIARGPHLAAMRENGLTLRIGGEELNVRPFCTDDPAAAGPQDYVLLAMKAHAVAGIVDAMQPLLGPDTCVVGAQNGIPWWYFYKHGGAHDGQRLACIDPGGRQWDGIGPERMLGCVVWQAAELVARGVVEHVYGERMPLGEPDGSRSGRALALSEALIGAGIKSPVRPKLRGEIWMKLWGNVSFNPVSVLTGATLETMARDPGVGPLIERMMVEAKAVAEALGIRFPMSVEARIKAAEEVGAHKTSMLTDLETGRPMEIEPLVGAVVELGRLTGVPTPTVEMVYHLTVLRAKQAGCYAG